MIQQTSLESYNKLTDLNLRQKEVLDALKQLGEANNLMISKKVELPINMVTPRVFELRGKGLIEESYKDKCPVTKKTTIFWKIKNK